MKYVSFILIFCLTSLHFTHIITAEKHGLEPRESLFIPVEKPIKKIEFTYPSGFHKVILDGFEDEKISVEYGNSRAIVLNGTAHTIKPLVASISLILSEKINESSTITTINDTAHSPETALVIFPSADFNDSELVQNTVTKILAKHKK